MREMLTQFDTTCLKCDKFLPQGSVIIYEKRIGAFCPGCAPTDDEEVRGYRQLVVDRRAARYDQYAIEREEKALTVDNPKRAAIHIAKAREFREKAETLRRAIRALNEGDRQRQAKREEVRSWIKIGMRVRTDHYGVRRVVKVLDSTAIVDSGGKCTNHNLPVDLCFVSKVE